MKLDALRKRIRGGVYSDEETLQDVTTDFGRLVYREPVLLVVPVTSQDVQEVVRFALEEGVPISTRGAGRSQGGQSLSEGGILLDMQGLARLGRSEDGHVWVQSGIHWRDLIERLWPRGLVPPVLTDDLDVTVGGTISTGGLGAASHRFGAQLDNVEKLEVVTGNGELVECSAEENHELFDSVRAGLGQFGIITRARLKLRFFSPNVRTFCILYDNLKALMEDQKSILREQRFDYIEGWCSPCMQGFKWVGETRVPFSEWFYPVHLSVEFEDSPPSESILHGLNFYRCVHVEDCDLRSYLDRRSALYELWRVSGEWQFPHPWMEVLLPWDRAQEYVEGVLRSFPSHLLAAGQVVLRPFRGVISKAPLFVHPEGEFVMGFGILPSVPRQHLKMTLALLSKASDLASQVGGKRYLSGWVGFDQRQWAEHFGDSWPRILQWKRFFDPEGILNPGFVHFHEAD